MKETFSRPTSRIGENVFQSCNVDSSYLGVTSLEMRFIVVVIKRLLDRSLSLIVIHFIIGNVY